MKKILLGVFISVLFLSACSGTKGLAPADVRMPESYIPGLDSDSLSIADLKWWQFYTDSTLVAIMHVVLDNNRDILKAAARINEMRELYGFDKANMFPSVGFQIQSSYETNKYDGAQTTKDPEFDLKFPISWEFNLWGALSHAKKAGAARFAASIEDYRAMRMELIAETASAYITYIALENELAIVRRTLQTRKESLEKARIRFEGGLTPETIYQQAVVEYSTTASLVPDLERRVAAARNALTLLMGKYPEDIFSHGNRLFDERLSERLPAGIPSDLLKRRPDLRAAELRLKAALEDVGVTYADRFPSLRIGFTPGFENDGLVDFFKSPFTYTLGSIMGSIFDFGRKKRKYKASKAVYEQSRLDYEKAVVGAFTEVNTSIIAYNKVKESRIAKTDLREAAKKYVQLARLQYLGGTLNYIDVLDAQRRYFDAQIGVNNALRDEYLVLVSLYKSLGGGWEETTRK